MSESNTRSTFLGAEDFNRFANACAAPAAENPALTQLLVATDTLSAEEIECARADLMAMNEAVREASDRVGRKGPHPRIAALRAEDAALRLLYTGYDEMPSDDPQAKHHSLMWTIQALIDSGFTVSYPKTEQQQTRDTQPG